MRPARSRRRTRFRSPRADLSLPSNRYGADLRVRPLFSERFRFRRKRSRDLSLTAAGLWPAPPRGRRICGGPLSRPVARPAKSGALQTYSAPSCSAWRASAMATRKCSSGSAPPIRRSPTTKAGVPLIPRALASAAFLSISPSSAGVVHVARELLGIEADGLRDGEDMVAVEGAVRLPSAPSETPRSCPGSVQPAPRTPPSSIPAPGWGIP